MKEIILLKNGEIALKGLNRRSFEEMMIKTMRRRLSPLGRWKFEIAQSTVTVMPEDYENADMDAAYDKLKKVFGIAKLSRAAMVEKDMDVIRSAVCEYLGAQLNFAQTFKVEAKRADKKFPLKSPEICNEIGGTVLSNFPHLRVDVHNPDVVVNVEIRDKHAFIHGNQEKGAGGMPSGSSGKAAILISGGIDSPVAAYMMAKRGVSLVGIHFAAPPYTSERAEMKVHSLLEKVAEYSGHIKLLVVPFTKIQELIKDNCPEEYFTLIMRRYMMRIADILARNEECGALITGESVAQVASQTMWALGCTDCVVDMPVFRPLIGMDKQEVIAISRDIETFDISVLPYEDCCTVFTPRHPKTHPKLPEVEKAESCLDAESLIREAVEGVRTVHID